VVERTSGGSKEVGLEREARQQARWRELSNHGKLELARENGRRAATTGWPTAWPTDLPAPTTPSRVHLIVPGAHLTRSWRAASDRDEMSDEAP
jgi:hypothetical protein